MKNRNFEQCFSQNDVILMEGALGERLKREYGLTFDEHVKMASLVYEEKGRAALKLLWNEYIDIARRYNLPFLATTPTRRTNSESAAKTKCQDSIINDNVQFLRKIQQNSDIEMYVGALLGCHGDAYTGEGVLSETEAYSFHKWEADHFKEAEADFLYAALMPTLPEAAGMAKALSDTEIPYIISFTIQEDGKLIDGTTIAEAIRYIDTCTDNNPICYMTNCVHPSIVCRALNKAFNINEFVKNRFCGIQANTSPLSYAELDDCEDLKCSEPEVFAEEMLKLRDMTKMKIWGGCCGTDNRHMECVAKMLCSRIYR